MYSRKEGTYTTTGHHDEMMCSWVSCIYRTSPQHIITGYMCAVRECVHANAMYPKIGFVQFVWVRVDRRLDLNYIVLLMIWVSLLWTSMGLCPCSYIAVSGFSNQHLNVYGCVFCTWAQFSRSTMKLRDTQKRSWKTYLKEEKY